MKTIWLAFEEDYDSCGHIGAFSTLEGAKRAVMAVIAAAPWYERGEAIGLVWKDINAHGPKLLETCDGRSDRCFAVEEIRLDPDTVTGLDYRPVRLEKGAKPI